MKLRQTYFRFRLLLLPLSISVILGGCAVALAPLAVTGGQLASSAQDNEIKMSFDEKTFTPTVREAMKSARHWAVVGDALEQSGEYVGVDSSRSLILGVKGLEMFEGAGIRISVERPASPPHKMLSSERKKLLETMCATTKADLAMFSVPVDANKGNSVVDGLLMRTSTNATGSINMLSCKGRLPYSFTYGFESQSGLLASDNRQANDQVAIAFAKQVIAALDATTVSVDASAVSNNAVPTTGSKAKKASTEKKSSATGKGTSPSPSESKK